MDGGGGGGDSDDDHAGAISSANAGFGVPEEDPNVDLALDLDEHFDIDQGKDRRVWLVKVPKFLLEKWQKVKSNNEELGRLRVYKKPLPSGEERIVLLLPPNKEGEEDPIPTEYFMTIQNKATQWVISSWSDSLTTNLTPACVLPEIHTSSLRETT